MTTREATHEQDAKLDRLCEEHGTLAITMVPLRGIGTTMRVENEDGTHVATLDEGGRSI